MKVYLAGPLFTEAEQEFNRKVRDALVTAGHEVFLPQEETGNLVGVGPDWPRKVFECDCAGLDSCEVVVAIMDGTQVDDGTAWECGYAYGRHPIVGLRTDSRKCGDGDGAVNLMLAESAETICGSIPGLVQRMSTIHRLFGSCSPVAP